MSVQRDAQHGLHLLTIIGTVSRRVSAGVGFIPIVGDIVLAVYKANSRNAKLLEEYLRVLGEEHIAAGMSDLTPEPPALPGVQMQETGTGAAGHAGNPDDGPPHKAHPAQSAAKQLVKDNSAGRFANEPAPASQRVAQSQEPVKRKRFGF